MTSWTLNLLGDCQLLVTEDGSPVRLATRKALALLAFLGRQKGRSATRQRIANLLWDTADAEQGRLHVRKALWIIRSAAEQARPGSPSPIETDGEQVRLSAAVTVDCEEFTAAIRAASDLQQLQAACELYRGDFLGETKVRQAPAFDEWAATQQSELRNDATAALMKLAEELAATEGKSFEAERATRRLIQLDPFHEQAHRLLMRLQHEQGRTPLALQHFRDFAQLLQRELDVSPEAETAALHQRILEERSGARRQSAVRSARADERTAPPAPKQVQAPAFPARQHRKRRAWLRWLVGGAMALGLATAGTAIQFGSPAPQQIQRIFPIVTGLKVAGQPALSPDGSRLVFAAEGSDGQQKLFLMTIGDRAPTPLTSGPGMDSDPAWSPDGTTIAFTRLVRPGDATCRIFVKTVPTGAERAVADCMGAASSRLVWSPDGSALFFADSEKPGRTASIVRLSLQSGRRENMTHADPRTLGDRTPVFVGRSLAFLRAPSRDTAELMLLDLTDGAVRQLTDDGASIGGVTAGPDGESLLFSSDRGGDAGLWSVPVSGGAPQRVSEGLLRYRSLSSSRSGKRLVFEGVRDRTGLAPLGEEQAGTNPEENDFREWYPNVARDGTVAFVSTRNGGQQIFIERQGSAPEQITRLKQVRISDARWSPDGQSIAFIGSNAGETSVYVLNRGGGTPQRLVGNFGDKHSPAWSRDGRSLYYVERRSGELEIWQIAVRPGAAPRRISTAGPTEVRADPLGRWLYFVMSGRSAIYRMALGPDGRLMGPLQKVASTQTPAGRFSWEVSADAVFVADRNALHRIDLADGRRTRLASAAGLNPRSAFTLGPRDGILLNRQSLKVELYGIELQ